MPTTITPHQAGRRRMIPSPRAPLSCEPRPEKTDERLVVPFLDNQDAFPQLPQGTAQRRRWEGGGGGRIFGSSPNRLERATRGDVYAYTIVYC